MKKMMFMETTGIEAAKTAAEITSLLVQSGARRIATDYDGKGEIVGLRFELLVKGSPWTCVLPARVDPVFKIINGRRKYDRLVNTSKDRDQAKRVAWRQLLRWAQAQLAMIETGMAEAAEVFLPYVEVSPGVTLFQKFIDRPDRMIEAPKDAISAEFV